MKIVYIKLENFIGVYAAMKRKSIELSFDKIDKPIIQIYGPNRSGKSVLEQQLHPFSTINLNGDERSDLPLILKGEVGIKNIVYEVDGKVYNILHTYKPTGNSHSISSSIMEDGVELNPSGGVGTFLTVLERVMGINKYIFQFVINGTQLTSFANLSNTQRKNIINKAMGIDIYDKIHKMSTDDYRYMSKLITSLSNTREFILSQYGNYENLCNQLQDARNTHDELVNTLSNIKTKIDSIRGRLSVIEQQNPRNELQEVESVFTAYKNAVDSMSIMNGQDISGLYDKLVNDQIKLNNDLNDLKSNRLLLMKDLDVLYDKKNTIESDMLSQKHFQDDYDNLIKMKADLKEKIDGFVQKYNITCSSDTLRSMMSLSQMINSSCKEIMMVLSKEQLELFRDMIINNIDINAFILEESSLVMTGEKEKEAIGKLHKMVNNVQGDFPNCQYADGCVYKRTFNMMDLFFKSYESSADSKYNSYDIENMEHAYKIIQTIYRMISIDIPEELRDMFDMSSIFVNMCNNQYGIDSFRIKDHMEEAARIEMRDRYIKEMNDIDKTLEGMTKNSSNHSINGSEQLSKIQSQIDSINDNVNSLNVQISTLEDSIKLNDMNRMNLSNIKNIDIKELDKRRKKLIKLIETYDTESKIAYQLESEYRDKDMQFHSICDKLDILEHAKSQYDETEKEITKTKESDYKYKVIAESTSPTKGKPVLAIRSLLEESMRLTNRLLDVMYNGEIQILEPTIDETSFQIPFRCGGNVSNDIRYGSQSESTLISLALTMSLASRLTKYNIRLLDEIDGFMDQQSAEVFVLMLNEMIGTLKVDQMFIISHKMAPHSHDEIVHVLDIAKEFNLEIDD